MMNDKSWIYGTEGKMNQDITPAQKRCICVFENKTGVKFKGTTKRDAMNYISMMKKHEEEYAIYKKHRSDKSS